MRDIAIEPAATLIDAQQALLRHLPRVLVFSGHTFMGTLAIEDESGKLADLTAIDSTNIGRTLLAQGLLEGSARDSSPRPSLLGEATHLRSTDTLARWKTYLYRLGGDLLNLVRQCFHLRWRWSESVAWEECMLPTAIVEVEAAPIHVSPSASISDAASFASSADHPACQITRIEQLAAARKLKSKPAVGWLDSARPAPSKQTASVNVVPSLWPHSPRPPHLKDQAAVDSVASSAAVLQRLQCVVLNGCKTEEIGRHLLTVADRISVVCWSTLAEDNAARAFSLGFYEEVHNLLERERKVAQLLRSRRSRGPLLAKDLKAAFIAGCSTFCKQGFAFGDPEAWFHPKGHPHNYCPEYTSCDGCTPPVHGECLLMRSVGGSVVVTRASDLFAPCKPALHSATISLTWQSAVASMTSFKRAKSKLLPRESNALADHACTQESADQQMKPRKRSGLLFPFMKKASPPRRPMDTQTGNTPDARALHPTLDTNSI